MCEGCLSESSGNLFEPRERKQKYLDMKTEKMGLRDESDAREVFGFAPAGRRVVATGEAQARVPTRD
jgi:hypothetical protein